MKPNPDLSTVFVSVIIPVYNDDKGLYQCLQALQQQTYPKEHYEVVVVDNASDIPLDGVVSPFPFARLVHEPKRGSYAARNTGLEAARGDIFAFTDADCIPTSDWLVNGVSHLMSGHNRGAVCGRIDVLPQIPGHPTTCETYDRLFGFQQEHWVNQHGYGACGNLITCRRIIDSVGAFNAALYSIGDEEWCNRVTAHGYELSYCDDACIKHPARASLKALVNKTLRTSGGVYDAAAKDKEPHPRRKLFTRLWFPNMHSVKLIFSDPGIPNFFQRIQVLALGILLRSCRVYENLRLMLGRPSRNL